MEKGYSKTGTDHVTPDRQTMYNKEDTYEGNMGHNIPNPSYEPSHVMNKKTGDIPGAGVK